MIFGRGCERTAGMITFSLGSGTIGLCNPATIAIIISPTGILIMVIPV